MTGAICSFLKSFKEQKKMFFKMVGHYDINLNGVNLVPVRQATGGVQVTDNYWN